MGRKRKAGFIVFSSDRSRVLLVKQKYHDVNPKWGCPKGHREFDETMIDAGLRELKEETGLTLDKNRQFKYINVCNTCYYIHFLDYDFIPFVHDTKEISTASFVKIERISNINTNLNL